MDKADIKNTAGLNPVVNQTNWRESVQEARVKFDDGLKTLYLEKLLDCGQKMLAADMVGISFQTIYNHYKKDPDFAKAMNEAIARRGQKIVSQLEKEALEGYYQPCFDKNGDHCGDKKIYETPLRGMVLKRFDPEYKDRKEIEHTGVAGGVLVVPASMTPQQWAEEAIKVKEEMEKANQIGRPTDE